MERFVKPNVVVSKCLGFENCRYDGQIISSDIVDDLRGHVDFVTVCPEMKIGLGSPRDPVRIVLKDDERRLMQPESGEDYTEEMTQFADDFLADIEKVDGFILKNNSPSCGIKDTKIYPSTERSAPVNTGSGLFGEAVLDNFSKKAIESDGRLRNYQIREHFLTKIFTLANFRDKKESGDLREFHGSYRLLLKSYDGDRYEELEYLKEVDDVEAYGEVLHDLLERPPPCQSKIEMMKDVFSDIEEKINEEEKEFFFDSLNKYLDGKSSLDVPLSVLTTWLIRFDKKEIREQSFFYPYPKELVRLEDIKTCVTRDYWPFD